MSETRPPVDLWVTADEETMAAALRARGWACAPPRPAGARQRFGYGSKTPVWMLPPGEQDQPWMREWAALFPTLSMRSYNCLIRFGFSIADVAHTPDRELLSVRNLGRRSLAEIRTLVPRDEALDA